MSETDWAYEYELIRRAHDREALRAKALESDLAAERTAREEDRKLIAELADALDSIPHLSDETVTLLARVRQRDPEAG